MTAVLLLLLSACGPKTVAPPVAAAAPVLAPTRTTMPGPLAPRDFQIPDPVEGTLRNGMRVVVVENHEVPLVYVNIAFKSGAWTDPAGKPGLASVTMDMLNEGAGGMSAAELSSAARELGANVGASAGQDGAAVSASCLKDELPGTLALMAQVLLHPDFPQADWELMRKKRLQDLAAARNDPRSIASRTWAVLGYGDQYEGHLTTEAAYKSITTKDMRAWYAANLAPRHAILTVGGDVSLDEIQPLLDQALGGFITKGKDLPALPQVARLPVQAPTRIYLVDKPGAAQSVLRVGRFVGSRTDPDYSAFDLANEAMGGMFTARINMNLREDKGWTYGAWAWVSDDYLPGRWQVGTSVVTPATVDAVKEILREVDDARGARPFTQDELDNGRGYLLGTLPLRFENPGTLMGETTDIWRYGLPADWLTARPAHLRAVSLEQAQAAWNARIDPDHLSVLVVGDAATVREGLVATGLPVVDMLPDGKPAR